jgi:hypothetical protein
MTSSVGERESPSVVVFTVGGARDAAIALLTAPRCLSSGQTQSRHNLRQSPQLGLISSHFFFLFLHIRQPVCTLRIRALGSCASLSRCRVASPPLIVRPFGARTVVSRGRHGRLSRVQREQGREPSQACLIWAQRWHTGRLSAPMAVKANRNQSLRLRLVVQRRKADDGRSADSMSRNWRGSQSFGRIDRTEMRWCVDRL